MGPADLAIGQLLLRPPCAAANECSWSALKPARGLSVNGCLCVTISSQVVHILGAVSTAFFLCVVSTAFFWAEARGGGGVTSRYFHCWAVLSSLDELGRHTCKNICSFRFSMPCALEQYTVSVLEL